MVSDNAATSAFGAASQPPARPHVNERQNSNERRDSVRLVLQPTRRNRTTCGPYPREQLDAAPVEKLAYALPVAASDIGDLVRRLDAWLP